MRKERQTRTTQVDRQTWNYEAAGVEERSTNIHTKMGKERQTQTQVDIWINSDGIEKSDRHGTGNRRRERQTSADEMGTDRQTDTYRKTWA